MLWPCCVDRFKTVGFCQETPHTNSIEAPRTRTISNVIPKVLKVPQTSLMYFRGLNDYLYQGFLTVSSTTM